MRLDTELAGLEHIDILKIDSEGGEYQALLGAQGILNRTDQLILEINRTMVQGDGPKFRTLLQTLRLTGWTSFRPSPPLEYRNLLIWRTAPRGVKAAPDSEVL